MAREPHEWDQLYLPADAEFQPMPADLGLSTPRFFPPPTFGTQDGLLCVGGRLSPEWLLDAYAHGIFPWPMSPDEPIAWWSPNPRGIIELDGLRVSRRLQRTLRSGKFHATCDRDFEGVIRACATVGDRRDGTWITPAMIEAYCRMHALGHAHSVEIWSQLRLPLGEGRGEGAPSNARRPNYLPKGAEMSLVGGVYGIAIGGLFAGESMFHRERDASKVALAHLVAHLRVRGYQLFDVQQWTLHTGSLGAKQVPRIEYLRRLARVVNLPVTFGEQLAGEA